MADDLLAPAGRAGRRTSVSLSILVASASPIDQYILRHPEYFFGSSPESGWVDPDNIYILSDQLKCAVFELPFGEEEQLAQSYREVLDYLEEHGVIRYTEGKWFWSDRSYPAEKVSLRSSAPAPLDSWPARLDSVERAVERLAEGGLVAYPTETVWGLAADASNPAAVERLRSWKGRAAAQPISLLAAAADGLALPPAGRALAAAFWPGPLTLVAPARLALASGIARHMSPEIALRRSG